MTDAPRPSRAAVEALRGAARHALDTGSAAAGRWLVPHDVALDDLAAAVRRHRCASFLERRADRLDERLGPLLAAAHEDERRPRLFQAVELSRAVDVLAAAGVRSLAVKGPCLAVLTEGDALARAPGDVDLLVAPDDVATAHGVLEKQGFTPPAQAPRPGSSWAWRHLLDSYYELPFVSAVTELDLHWRLDPTVHALPDFDTLWAARTPVEVAGHAIDTVGPAHALQHACSNAARDDWRWLRSLVDVHLLAARDDVWDALPAASLRRVDLVTLTVTRTMLGLPPTVPADVLARLDRPRPRATACARRWQERPQPWQRLVHVPGAEWPTQLRRHLRGATDAGDVLRVLRGITLLPLDAGHATADTAVCAVPQLVLGRLRHAVGVVREGRP